MAEREKDGRFGAGNRANPGGRTKAHRDVVELARKRTVRAIKALTEIMESSEDDGARVKAATVLLERGWGRPLQTSEVAITITDEREMTREQLLAIVAGEESAPSEH